MQKAVLIINIFWGVTIPAIPVYRMVMHHFKSILNCFILSIKLVFVTAASAFLARLYTIKGTNTWWKIASKKSLCIYKSLTLF